MSAVRSVYRRRVEESGLLSGSDLEDIAAIAIIRAGLLEGLVQQYRVQGYRLDFAWPAVHIAVEIDGPTHFAPYAAARDAIRDAELRASGWVILRVDGEGGPDALMEQMVRVTTIVAAEEERS